MTEWWCGKASAAAAAAKSLKSCPILCDPTDGSPPGSPVPGILQARTLEGLPFLSPMHESEKGKWSRSVVWLLVTPWTAGHQALPCQCLLQRPVLLKDKCTVTHSSSQNEREDTPHWYKREKQSVKGTEDLEKGMGTTFIEVSVSKKEGRVNTVQLASLNNSSGLWGTGLVPNCLVSFPVLI